MASKQTPCLCQSFEFGTFDPDTEQDDTYTTQCTQFTTKTFAQGHDAKLVGFLVRAELAGEEISITEGGMRVTFAGAVSAARTISDRLANKALVMLMAREAKIASKVAREHGQTTKKVEVAPAPVKAKIKVGRWTYQATIDQTTGIATYQTRLGATHQVGRGAYQEM